MAAHITYGSVCSGIEAASQAWEPIGFVPLWFAEIEPFPKAVLAHRYPTVPDLGDMTQIARKVAVGEVHAPTILVGGTPCQAFSVAGLRAGLDDPRGQLTLKYVELLDAIDSARRDKRKHPAICVWENVPGVLSSRDNAFGCFLAALAGEDDELVPAGKKWTNAGCVYGPKRAVAWRILDAQHFGLAQRRRRVFVVASARDGFDPAAVLFEREGVRRDNPPRRGEGQDVARAADERTAFGGGRTSGAIEVAACLVAKGQKCDFEVETFVVHGTQDPCVSTDTAFALGRNNGGENAVFATQNATRGKDQNGLGVADWRGPMYTLDQASQHAVCVTGDITHTLKAEGFDGSGDGTGRGQPIVAAFLHMNKGRPAGRSSAHEPMVSVKDHVPTLTTDGHQQSAVSYAHTVRRLTPRETERLQGFPDNWTLIPWRGKPASECPDGPRYKAIGNSKAVPVVRWIGNRIKDYLLTLDTN